MIYLFNGKEELIQIIGQDQVREALWVQHINNPETLEVTLSNFTNIDNVEYIGHLDTVNYNELHLYKIKTIQRDGQHLKIAGVQSAFDDLLADGYIKDRRFSNSQVIDALDAVLEGSRWRHGVIASHKTFSDNFYYLSRLEALKKITSRGLEVSFRIIFNGKKVIGRLVDIYEPEGADYGVRFVHGEGLLNVLRSEERSGIITALVGRGKGEKALDDKGSATGGYGRCISFKDVEWTTSNGKPVDKPLGLEYVEKKDATMAFGYPDGKPRVGVVTFSDIEEPQELLSETYRQLEAIAHPKIAYSAEVRNGRALGLGETVKIIRKDLGIAYKTRVYKRSMNLLTPENVKIELGDEVKDYSLRRLETLEKKAETKEKTNSQYISEMITEMANLYWGEDGYNYDLKKDNAYGFKGGVYSFDKPIDQSPSKFVAISAGKLLISDKKNPDGSWKISTIMDGKGLGTGTVGADQIIAGSVNASKIAAKTITANQIATGTITSSQIKAGSITAKEIAANTITSSEIKAGSITANDITTGILRSRGPGGSYFDLNTGYLYAKNGTFEGTVNASNITTGYLSADRINGGTLNKSDISRGQFSATGNSAQLRAGASLGGAGSNIKVDRGLRIYSGNGIAVFENAGGNCWLGIYGGDPNVAANARWAVGFNGQVYTSSDRRFKKDITRYEDSDAMEAIRSADVFNYKLRNDAQGANRVGIIAQLFLKRSTSHASDLVIDKTTDAQGTVSYRANYDNLYMLGIGAIRDLDKRLTELENKKLTELDNKPLTELENKDQKQSTD